MSRAAKACTDPHCPNQQPCPDHRKVPWKGSTRRRSLPSDWEARRKVVLDRDLVCTDGTVCHGLAPSTEVHHTGDRDDHRIEVLAGVCADCHALESSRQGNAARVGRDS